MSYRWDIFKLVILLFYLVTLYQSSDKLTVHLWIADYIYPYICLFTYFFLFLFSYYWLCILYLAIGIFHALCTILCQLLPLTTIWILCLCRGLDGYNRVPGYHDQFCEIHIFICKFLWQLPWCNIHWHHFVNVRWIQVQYFPFLTLIITIMYIIYYNCYQSSGENSIIISSNVQCMSLL